jgi:hypothetical protein
VLRIVVCVLCVHIGKELFAETSPFVLITIPKSGSHLTIKALYHLTGGTPVWHTRFPSLACISPKDGFLYTHLVIHKCLEEDYEALPQLKKILNIRDLRDVAISMIGHIMEMPWPGMTEDEIEEFREMPFDDQLMFVIKYDYEIKPTDPIALQVSLPKIAEQAIKFYQKPDVLVCRYENLVGAQGGGTSSAQVEELRKMASHLSIVNVSDDDLFHIGLCIYGNHMDVFKNKGFEHYASTFRKGKTGGWKRVFKAEHKEAFKERFGQALIDLGYEQDLNW